jgi:hypothetical protein
MTQGLHNYVAPAPGTSPNASYYASNGYLWFMPDVVYEVGYPGKSCVKCVTSGVQHLVAQGFVDPNGIAASGHSWGGYQTAFLVTRTNLFAVRRERGAGQQHAVGLWRHPLRVRRVAAVPVRDDAVAHRRHAVAVPAALPWRTRRSTSPTRWQTPVLILAQRPGRRGAVDAGHRVLHGPAPARQGVPTCSTTTARRHGLRQARRTCATGRAA